MQNKMKPCPFCGSFTPVVAFTRVDAETNWWNAECHDCGAQHTPANSEAEAIAAWNARPEPASPPQTATPALALTAAALRAIAEGME